MTVTEAITIILAVLGILAALAAASKEGRASFKQWLANLVLIAVAAHGTYQVIKFCITDGAPSRLDIFTFSLSMFCVISASFVLLWEYRDWKRKT